MRWRRVSGVSHRLREQERNTAASSFNTLHPCPIGPKKASLLNSSSQLAGIVCTSNPWSLRQSSSRSSCSRCFCVWVAPGFCIEVAPTFLLLMLIQSQEHYGIYIFFFRDSVLSPYFLMVPPVDISTMYIQTQQMRHKCRWLSLN